MTEVLRLRDEGIEWRTVEDQVLALDTDSQTFLSTNRTGTVLWSALADGGTRESLVERLLENFDVAEDVAARDVDVFLGALAREGLLAAPE